MPALCPAGTARNESVLIALRSPTERGANTSRVILRGDG